MKEASVGTRPIPLSQDVKREESHFELGSKLHKSDSLSLM